MTAYKLRAGAERDNGLGCAFAIILGLPIMLAGWLALAFALGLI